MLKSICQGRGFQALLAAALVTGGVMLAPGIAQADEGNFAGLIPGQAVAEGELGGLYGKGVTSSSSSTSSSTTGGGGKNLGLRLLDVKALARSSRKIGPDFSGKNAARASLGSLTFPMFSVASEIEISIISE